MKEKPFISVYAIARNEAQFAQRWYDCFKEADEVCVLVNNSTDDTAYILNKLGAIVKVVTCNKFRFDKARNDAMRLCSPKADLLFCVDLDDMIDHGWRNKIDDTWARCTTRKRMGIDGIQYGYKVQYMWNGRPWLQEFVRHNIHTPKGWEWRYRVHEQLCFKEGNPTVANIEDIGIVSFPDVEKDHSSYLPLLLEDAKENPDDSRIIHLVGREYMNNKKYARSILWLKDSLKKSPQGHYGERANTMRFLAECNRALGNLDEMELWFWRSLAEDPNCRDGAFALGKYLLEQKRYRQAIVPLVRCVSIPRRIRDVPSFCPDAWGALPHFYLAEAYFHACEFQKSKEQCLRGLEIDPDNKTGQLFLAQFGT